MRTTPLLLRLGVVVSLTATAACWGAPPAAPPGGPLSASLTTDPESGRHVIRVTGWSDPELDALADARLTAEAWGPILSLHVGDAGTVAVAATYRVTPAGVELVPAFPLDPGRAYTVRIDASRRPLARMEPAVVTPLTVPADAPGALTSVTTIFPSADVWPENTLRFYLHFSGPMSGTSAIGHVRLVDAEGADVADVLLDIDVDLWNPEFTRRTVFFDPGRVKRGIRPNRELGRALVAGRRYAIVVGTTWKDARGRPLAREFRHLFTAGPAVEAAVDPAAWTIAGVAPATRQPLVVTFPWALDEGLLQRAVGVQTRAGTAIAGTITVDQGERRWGFIPSEPWPSTPLSLVVLTLLEDPAGNRVGEPFEFEMFGKPAPEVERVTLPIPKT